jgi:hypothetical protein
MLEVDLTERRAGDAGLCAGDLVIGENGWIAAAAATFAPPVPIGSDTAASAQAAMATMLMATRTRMETRYPQTVPPNPVRG